ncbi:MAG: outer membrane beta-barrel protein [Bacteroidaceae bacterium]|nr:outer membrane beta-barrel protein [Bacteroidaceae bacterium]
MKNIFLKSAILIAAMMMTMCVSAKTNDIGGKVTDAQGEPLAYVNVVLLSLPDSAFVQGAVTDTEGKFKIVSNRNEGLLQVSFVGYQTQYVKAANGLTIVLEEDAQMLGEVVVKAQLPKTKLTGEGLQTNVKGSVLEHAGTADDVLAKTPGLIKGPNGLEVMGKGSPLVYINGRKITDASELSRLQSNEIQSVEVITNPGAQYDATVRSVVRIRTIRRQGDGFGFNLNVSDSQSLKWKKGNDPSAAFNMNYRTGGVDFFAGINYNRNTSRQIAEIDRKTYAKRMIENNSDLSLDYFGQSLYGNAGVNWQIDDKHFVGGKFEWGTQLSHKTEMNTGDMVQEDGVLIDKLTTRSVDRIGGKTPYNMGVNLYYNGTIGSKLGVDVNLDYYGSKDSRKSVSNETSTMTHDAEILSHSDNNGHLYAAKAIVSYPIWKGQLQVGTEESFSRRDNNYTITGIDIPASKAEVKEDIYAGFANYGFNLPKIGQISAGIRYENVHYTYLDAVTPANNLTRNYGNWFPTVSFAGRVGKVQLMLNYSARTRRPNYAQLSSAISYDNRYLLQSGNAQLQPELIHNVSATAVWKFLTFMVNYSRTNDPIMTWSSPYNDEGVILVKPRNIDTPFRMLVVYSMINHTIGPWTMSYTLGIQKQWLTINAPDSRTSSGFRETKFNDKPIGVMQLNNTFRLNGGWQLELGGLMQTKGYTQNIYMRDAFFNLTAAVQKTLLKDNSLVLRIEGNDLIHTAKTNVDSDFGSHTISQNNMMDTQRVKFSLRYTFNAAQSKYRGTGAGTDQKSRM